MILMYLKNVQTANPTIRFAYKFWEDGFRLGYSSELTRNNGHTIAVLDDQIFAVLWPDPNSLNPKY